MRLCRAASDLTSAGQRANDRFWPQRPSLEQSLRDPEPLSRESESEVTHVPSLVVAVRDEPGLKRAEEADAPGASHCASTSAFTSALNRRLVPRALSSLAIVSTYLLRGRHPSRSVHPVQDGFAGRLSPFGTV